MEYEVRYDGGARSVFASFDSALRSARRNCQLRGTIEAKFHRIAKHDDAEIWSLQNYHGQICEIEKID